MARMIAQSKIIAYHTELQAALLAALKVADKKLFGSVQFRPMPEAGVLQVSALNATSTFVASVPLEMCDVVDQRDEIFETPLSEASVLARFPIKLPKGDDDATAKSGLIISDSWIQITDETGLGIGIRHARVRRNSEIEMPGSPARTIEQAHEMPAAWDSEIYPDQMDLAGRVAAIMGQKCELRPLDVGQTALSRILVIGSTYGMTITEGRENGVEEDKPGSAPGPDDQPLNFDDDGSGSGTGAPDSGSDFLKSGTGIHIVRSTPPEGAS